eukprot:1771871-Ditylum_brightwellii.AAC.1
MILGVAYLAGVSMKIRSLLLGGPAAGSSGGGSGSSGSGGSPEGPGGPEGPSGSGPDGPLGGFLVPEGT